MVVSGAPDACCRTRGVPRPGLGLCALAVFVLSACGGPGVVTTGEQDGPPSGHVDVSTVPDAVPRVEPRSRYGNPRSYVVNGRRYHTLRSSAGYRERGVASWYGTKFHGRRTSSGEPYDMYAMTAAHRSLPLPTYVEVTNLSNGRRIVVRVNDRGPFHPNRIIDLSYTGASKLGILGKGTGLVEVRAIDPRAPRVPYRAEPTPPAERAVPAGLFVQVGAFQSLSNAERMRSRVYPLADSGVRISEATSAGRTVYRVRIGPLRGVEHADRLTESLTRIGVEESRIVLD